jgi:hypothetical protein
MCRLRRHALKPDAAAQDAPHIEDALTIKKLCVKGQTV